ncbi:hypothetical protein [Halobacillus sp. BBL2006]|uniref:hypothetical protein n=1 Tax=Halobacillus sp. BBL2006 TaxID=1543706 RepID=UPI000542850B|nr:hypothetical protein [Halobacillus sp. BBL2006]KHE71963.1 hypothetical protein LD39_07050 [Halobacillus sp. BBL2006]
MKRFIILIGVVLFLVACTYEGSGETNKNKKESSGQGASASTVKVEPAKLSEREQSLVNQIGGDYQTFYTIDGKVEEGDILVTSIVVIKEGEKGEEVLSSVAGTMDQKKFKKDLHSFQVQVEEEATYLTIGSPNGYARGSTTIPDNITSFLFEQKEEEVKIKKGEPIYIGYLIGSSQSSMSIQANDDLTTLPKSVKEAEYAAVFKVELKEEKDL